MTEYRIVPGTTTYRVGDDGSYWRLVGDEWVQVELKGKYRRVTINGETFSLHNLILTVFVGPRPRGLYGLHNDDDQSNNRLVNLRWGTATENARDRSRNGKGHNMSGSRAASAKLHETDIPVIRSQWREGLDRETIGAIHGIHPNTVRGIVDRRSWKHVPEEAI